MSYFWWGGLGKSVVAKRRFDFKGLWSNTQTYQLQFIRQQMYVWPLFFTFDWYWLRRGMKRTGKHNQIEKKKRKTLAICFFFGFLSFSPCILLVVFFTTHTVYSVLTHTPKTWPKSMEDAKLWLLCSWGQHLLDLTTCQILTWQALEQSGPDVKRTQRRRKKCFEMRTNVLFVSFDRKMGKWVL